MIQPTALELCSYGPFKGGLDRVRKGALISVAAVRDLRCAVHAAPRCACCAVHAAAPLSKPSTNQPNLSLSRMTLPRLQGKATSYALGMLEPRGVLFVEPAADVYEGQVVGEHSRCGTGGPPGAQGACAGSAWPLGMRHPSTMLTGSPALALLLLPSSLLLLPAHRETDLEVNPVKAKKLTNVRNTGSEERVSLAPPRLMTLEDAIG